MDILIKRVYEKPNASDGMRILVDRLWPRGLSKQKADIALWMKEIAPSADLRKWFHHDPEKWNEFQKRYRKELTSHKDLVDTIKDYAKKGTVTLVYGAKDTQHNEAVVLYEDLKK